MWSSPPPCWSHGLFGICKPTPGSTNRAGLAFPLNWINRNQDGDVGIEERWGKKTYLKPWWGCTRCDSCTGCHPGEKIFKTINFWRKRFNCDHLPHASAGIVEDVLDLVQLRHPEKNWRKPILLLQNVKQILRKTEKYEREPVTESFTMALQQYLGLIQRVLESISKCNFSFLFFVPPPLHHHHDHHNRHLFNSPLQPAPLGSLVVPLAHFLKVSHFQPSIYFHPYLVRPLLLVRNPSALFDIGQSSCVTDADVKI